MVTAAKREPRTIEPMRKQITAVKLMAPIPFRASQISGRGRLRSLANSEPLVEGNGPNKSFRSTVLDSQEPENLGHHLDIHREIRKHAAKVLGFRFGAS